MSKEVIGIVVLSKKHKLAMLALMHWLVSISIKRCRSKKTFLLKKFLSQLIKNLKDYLLNKWHSK